MKLLEHTRKSAQECTRRTGSGILGRKRSPARITSRKTAEATDSEYGAVHRWGVKGDETCTATEGVSFPSRRDSQARRLRTLVRLSCEARLVCLQPLVRRRTCRETPQLNSDELANSLTALLNIHSSSSGSILLMLGPFCARAWILAMKRRP